MEKVIRPISSAIEGFVLGLASTGRIECTTARNVTILTKAIANLILGSSRTHDKEVEVQSNLALGISIVAGVVVGCLTEPEENKIPKQKTKRTHYLSHS